jgi:hypothetical protein
MRSLQGIVAALMLAAGLAAHPHDARSTFELLKKGRDLSAKDAEKLEERLTKKPDDEDARIQLLVYYSTPPNGVDLATVKSARARHIFWIVENDPKDGLGLFQVGTGVYRLNCQGDDLADPEAAKRAGEMWLEQVKRDPANAQIRRSAVEAIQFCAPEQAERILTDANDGAGLGRLYAVAALGIAGDSYQNSDPSGSDPALRERPFAIRARQALEEATDKDVLTAAVGTLLRQGAILWADGKLDWDYTALGDSVLAKAKELAPDMIGLLTLPAKLPARGERPPVTIRVGGNVQQAKLVRKIAPTYPAAARDSGIQGIVKLNVLIGLDGKIMYWHADAGPAELIPASVEAV